MLLIGQVIGYSFKQRNMMHKLPLYELIKNLDINVSKPFETNIQAENVKISLFITVINANGRFDDIKRGIGEKIGQSSKI